MKIPLIKPIEAHGETLKELDLREPLGEDIEKCGIPFDVIERDNGDVISQFNTANAAKMICALASIPPSSFRKLSAPDTLKAMMALLSFFGVSGPATPSTDVGSSPASSTG